VVEYGRLENDYSKRVVSSNLTMSGFTDAELIMLFTFLKLAPPVGERKNYRSYAAVVLIFNPRMNPFRIAFGEMGRSVLPTGHSFRMSSG
jgi:hypothetical protein